jgi:hypothetical protein
MTTYNTSKAVLDGIVDTFVTPEEFEAERELHRQQLAQLAALRGDSPRPHEQTTPQVTFNTEPGSHRRRLSEMIAGFGPEGTVPNTPTYPTTPRDDTARMNANTDIGQTPPHLREVQQLATVVHGLADQLRKNSQVQDSMLQVLQLLKEDKAKPAPPPITVDLTSHSPVYAVYKGHTPGIYHDWNLARRAIEGFFGAEAKRFRNEADALSWMEMKRLNDEGMSVSSDVTYLEKCCPPTTTTGAGKPREAASQLHGDPAQPTIFQSHEERTYDRSARHGWTTIPTTDTPTPPTPLNMTDVIDPSLLGPDPSTGKKNEAFNVSTRLEGQVLKMLCPKGITETTQRELAETAVDFTSLPGKFTSASSNAADSAYTSDAFAAVVSDMTDTNSRRLGLVPRDTQWRASSKNALERLKTLDDVYQATEDIASVFPKALDNMEGQIQEILVRAGWEVEHATLFCAAGILPRLIREAVHYFERLHLKILFLGFKSWEGLGVPMLTHHANELGTIRRYSNTRLQLIVNSYCYLRDAQAGNFMDIKLNSKMMTAFQVSTSPTSQTSLTTNLIITHSCGHCHDVDHRLHAGGKKDCPANKLSTRSAQNLAKRADGDSDKFVQLVTASTNDG